MKGQKTMRHTAVVISLVAGTAVALTGCTSASSGGGGASAAQSHGPIKVWLSNNAQEVAWGTQMVSAWNSAHPSEKVTAEQIPAGKSSEEVIGAAITAGNAPCLIFNTSPAAVPQFQKQGGLVSLSSFSDGASYVESRTGGTASQYKSTDGQYYQIPWKDNPVMIFYNKDILKKAGIDPANPPLKTYSDFLATSKKIVDSKAAQAAIWPSPTSEFFQPWFDFYPLYAAQSGGKQLVQDKKSTFNDANGKAVADFWASLYQQGLAPKEAFSGDAFGTGKSAMAIVGPWAIAAYSKVNWGAVPVPTQSGMDAAQIHTFSDAKNIGLYSACKNSGTAWDLAKFATSKDQDGKLLDMTGQMPMRTNLVSTFPAYFKQHPEYSEFADMASRTVEVPNMQESVAAWQAFRDEYSKAVIFGKEDTQTFLKNAADKIDQLAAQG